MKQFAVRGTNFECGFQLGGKFKKELHSKLDNLNLSPKRYMTLLQNVHALCAKKYPQYIDELKGLSEGAEVDYWAILLLNSPEVMNMNRCSSIAVNTDSTTLIAHNEDEDKGYRKDQCVLVKFVQKRTQFTAFVYLGELPGSAYSWNSHGMVFTTNSLAQKKYSTIRIPTYFTGRALIETKTFQDAKRILKNSNTMGGFHYFISKDKKIISVEQLNDKLSYLNVNGIYAHTNHYIHNGLSKNASISKSSGKRLERVRELLKTNADPLKILFDKKNSPYCIYNGKNDVNITLSSAVFYPKEKLVKIYDSNSVGSVKKFHM